MDNLVILNLLIGFITEDVTNLGGIDLTIATLDMSQVYVIEFSKEEKNICKFEWERII
jgi:hypothetical protein